MLHVLQGGYSKTELNRLHFSGTSSSLLQSMSTDSWDIHGLLVETNALRHITESTNGVRLPVNIPQCEVLRGYSAVPTTSGRKPGGRHRTKLERKQRAVTASPYKAVQKGRKRCVQELLCARQQLVWHPFGISFCLSCRAQL